MTDQFVVLGVARVRSTWFRELSQWSTSAALPVDFVKCISLDEVRARLGSGRAFSGAADRCRTAGPGSRSHRRGPRDRLCRRRDRRRPRPPRLARARSRRGVVRAGAPRNRAGHPPRTRPSAVDLHRRGGSRQPPNPTSRAGAADSSPSSAVAAWAPRPWPWPRRKDSPPTCGTVGSSCWRIWHAAATSRCSTTAATSSPGCRSWSRPTAPVRWRPTTCGPSPSCAPTAATTCCWDCGGLAIGRRCAPRLRSRDGGTHPHVSNHGGRRGR